jgi:hypothetical protein
MRLFAAAHAAPDREVQLRQKRYFAPSASGHWHCLRFDPMPDAHVHPNLALGVLVRLCGVDFANVTWALVHVRASRRHSLTMGTETTDALSRSDTAYVLSAANRCGRFCCGHSQLIFSQDCGVAERQKVAEVRSVALLISSAIGSEDLL